MQYRQPKNLPLIQLTKSPIPATLAQILKVLKQPSAQASALLLTVGFGLNIVIPTYATGTASQTTPPIPKSQTLSQKPQTVELTFVSYSVTQAAYSKIIPQFAAKWKREHNQDVRIKQSYGGSGSQARAVIEGLDADVVALSLALDVKKIEKSGLIQPGWEQEAPNGSIVTRSVVALVTRPGNPKKIVNWTDLAKPGITVITPNPKTSGGAMWNFLALWSSVTKTGGNENKARQFVSNVYTRVPVLPRDAREATDVFFKRDQGDVLVTYEHEVLLARQRGEGSAPFIVPQLNFSIDNPVAVVDKNVDKHGTRKIAEAFVKYLYTPEAQREFANVGFRPVSSAVSKETSNKFGKVTKLVTVKELGGWETVQKKFFSDGGVFDQIQASSR